MNQRKLYNLLLLGILITIIIIPFTTVTAANSNYVSNRSPLVNTPFVPLPLGVVKADGWLLTQLQMFKDGVTGNAEALYSELGSNSAWLGGSAANSDWERPPYYVKGLVALAYTLGDSSLQTKAKKWIDWAINSQQSNGFFGPSTNNDWWPRMPMLYAIKDYYEATGDSRVIPFMQNYFTYMKNNLGGRPLAEWGKSRVGDQIDTVLWLYNRNGDSTLLTLADTLKNQGYDLTGIYTNNTFLNFGSDFQPKHNVNVSEDIKMPTIYYQKSNNAADRDAFINGHNNLLSNHGQVTGMSSGTEMLAGRNAGQGVELCAVVERMQSCEEAQMILGNAAIGDQLEKVAFNAFPAAFNKSDFHVHQYYTLPNQVQSVSGSHGFQQDYANGIMPSWQSGYPCCRYNMHMGWPYFVKNMWAATSDNGLAVMAYGPSHLTAKVASGTNVTFTENTNYPFETQIRFTLTTSSSVAFPLKLRIPAWCGSPGVKVNGTSQSGVSAGSFYTINRTWANNDTVTVDLPMTIKTSTWSNNAVAVERGPLVFSLKINESWTTTASGPLANYNECKVTPTSAWNYGLVLDPKNPGASITVSIASMPSNPFLQGTTPVTLKANAKQITWGMASNGIDAAEPPISPISSTNPTVQVTLVPFGAENLRVTYFPLISNGTTPYFMIVNKNSGKALDLIGGDTGNGARINQWTYDYNGPNQRWAIVPDGNHFKIISYVSGKSACIVGDSMSDGAQLHDWDYTGGNPAQQFDFIDAGNGWYKIKNVKSGKMLDVDGFGTANDAKVQQWADNGGQANQLWRLQPWGDYYIKADSGRYVCIQNSGNTNGSRIIQYDFQANPWFKWRFENVGDGWSKVTSLNALTKVLCVSNGSTTPGAYCHLWDYNTANIGDQKVRIVPRLNGKVKLYFAHDGQSFDIPNGQTGNNVELDQYTNNNNSWQEFTLERVQ